MMRVFKLYDKNGDGTVTIKDFPLVMRILGQKPTYAEYHYVIKELDPDGHGWITFMKFIDL